MTFHYNVRDLTDLNWCIDGLVEHLVEERTAELQERIDELEEDIAELREQLENAWGG